MIVTPLDSDRDQTKRIRICEITKEDKRAVFYQDDPITGMPSFSVERGRKYEVLLRFVGKNFSDRRTWHLILDLTHDQPKFDLVGRNIFS